MRIRITVLRGFLNKDNFVFPAQALKLDKKRFLFKGHKVVHSVIFEQMDVEDYEKKYIFWKFGPEVSKKYDNLENFIDYKSNNL
mmetsp:Transcript_1848/g.2059  ORF Transcript_1848/g.2059 Transcript_1848/m.2059 type:complete len:84 (+) Transcript_1848:130-381(+)